MENYEFLWLLSSAIPVMMLESRKRIKAMEEASVSHTVKIEHVDSAVLLVRVAGFFDI
jgi:hypothetical protein